MKLNLKKLKEDYRFDEFVGLNYTDGNKDPLGQADAEEIWAAMIEALECYQSLMRRVEAAKIKLDTIGGLERFEYE